MATSKTLTPTNVTIQIPEFTDQPDQRVNSNCIDKEADAINALNTQTATLTNGSHTFWATLSQNAYQGTYFAQICGNFKGKTITKDVITALSGTSSYNITNDTTLSVIDNMQINIATTASGLGGCPITVKVTVS